MNSFNLHRSFNINGRFELNTDVFNELRTMKHSQILLTVPLSGIEKELNLKRNFISNGTTRIVSNSGRVYSPNENIVHYGGRVEGSDLSFVAISFTEHGIYGIIEDNFVVYGFDNLPDGTYSLSETPADEEPWACDHESIPEEDLEPSLSPLQENLLTSTATSKCIYIRWDVDYSVIQKFGSTGATDTYIQALFNAHQQLFWNEGIQIYLNEVIFYDTAPSGFLITSDVLGNYGAYLNSIDFQSTSSDCAQFLYYITPGGGGSGSAWRPGLCNFYPPNPPTSFGPYAQTRMNIFDGDGTPSSVIYNRTVKVITHELGHNLGCHHTFGCYWNLSWTPGASTFGSERIDGSGGATYNPREGSCFVPVIPPGFIGTIMSYCDSTGLCGVSFALGFGPIPRQRMIDRINTTTCTTICSEPLPTPAPTPLVTPTPTKTSTPTKTINFTPNPTSTTTKTPTPTKTINSTPTTTPTLTNTPTVTKTQTPTKTKTLTPNLSPNQTSTPTNTPTFTPTQTITSNFCNPYNCNTPIRPPMTVNGIFITSELTGTSLNVPIAYSSCNNTVISPPNILTLGYSSPFTYKLNFSVPITSVVMYITGAGLQNIDCAENFTVNTNSGIPSITSPTNCFTTINNNVITMNTNGSSQIGAAGGIFLISNPTPFTSVSVAGLQVCAGSYIVFCGDSLICPIQFPTLTPTSTPSVTPTITQTPTKNIQIIPKVDFVCIHWYKGVDSNLFINDITDIINLYNKPIWVTEFAPQDSTSSQNNPNLYTQTEVNNFINTVIPWMNSNSMVERYAWHDSKTGTSAIFTIDGQLTETGITYRDAQ
jgi:hypothetical protein